MSTIVELTLPAEDFEMGEVLRVEGATEITLETMVPLGGRPTPFVRVRNSSRDTFEDRVRKHPSVSGLSQVGTHDGETVYALQWEPSDESFIDAIRDLGGVLLEATGGAETWRLELRFPDQDALSRFQDYYVEQDVQVTIERIYNLTRPEAGGWYGLTAVQRETLAYAVEAGYYSLPRGISTKDLAAEFDISDQAATERLRRGIDVLVRNALLTSDEDQ